MGLNIDEDDAPEADALIAQVQAEFAASPGVEINDLYDDTTGLPR